jgi:5-methylcytosine-specific restriction endonuclease McrA
VAGRAALRDNSGKISTDVCVGREGTWRKEVVMETLVLNPSYQPVARIPWQRAITLLFLGKVEIVEAYEDRTIRSVSFEVKMPSVIRFFRLVTRRKPVIRFSRENVYARDTGRCQYCRLRVTRSEATYDHIVPRSQGGKTNWENIVTAPVRPTKLPDIMRLTFTFQKGMPPTWKTWLRDLTYWHGSLEEE